jgi:hypothetical protein
MILNGRRKADQLAGSTLDQPVPTRPDNAVVDTLWRRLRDLQMPRFPANLARRACLRSLNPSSPTPSDAGAGHQDPTPSSVSADYATLTD